VGERGFKSKGNQQKSEMLMLTSYEYHEILNKIENGSKYCFIPALKSLTVGSEESTDKIQHKMIK
jgi:hypothetical protein